MDPSGAIPNQLRFYGPYFPQNWSLPESIIYYITKNPSSEKVYQKLIRSCKHFYAKNPITVCKDLIYDRRNQILEIRENKDVRRTLDLVNISGKFWITRSMIIQYDEPDKRNLASKIIPHIFRCDAEYLELWNQDISFEDFLFLSKNSQCIQLNWCTVKDKNGSPVSIEKLVEHASEALLFKWVPEDGDSNISKETVKNLMQIPHFKTLKKFSLMGIVNTFDIETFYDYIKKNQSTRIELCFSQTISEDYKNRLDAIVDEILEAAENCDYQIPYINYLGLNEQKFSKLRDLAWK